MATLYQRSSDGRWVVAVEAGGDRRRKRRVISTTDRSYAEQVYAEMPRRWPVRTRAENLALARERGTRTAHETRAKRRSQPGVCPYCKTALNVFNEVEDHIVPVARGGSDAIDNIHWICWECNLAKLANPAYRYTRRKPRPFRVMPQRRRDYENGRRAIL